MTNADKVRQMSDTELGELFNAISREGDSTFTHAVCTNCREHHNNACPLESMDDPCPEKYVPYGSDDMMNWLVMEIDSKEEEEKNESVLPED